MDWAQIGKERAMNDFMIRLEQGWTERLRGQEMVNDGRRMIHTAEGDMKRAIIQENALELLKIDFGQLNRMFNPRTKPPRR